MCADRDQSVRSWGSVESGVGVEIRNGVDGVTRERKKGLMGERRREKEGAGERPGEGRVVKGYSDMECASYDDERAQQKEIEECVREDTE